LAAFGRHGCHDLAVQDSPQITGFKSVDFSIFLVDQGIRINNPVYMRKVRRAKPEDAKGIHDAHMKSIQEVCAKDHTAEEIQAWGYRPFSEDHRINAIKNQFVWVVATDEVIEGYGHFGLEKKDDKTVGYIFGLYLAPEALGQGLGSYLTHAIIEEASRLGVKQIILDSTITAHQFYEHLGFKDSGLKKTLLIGGVQIQCFPMSLTIAGT
jgi:putative acetyltransferase